MFTTKKKASSTVGLEIETGSIAATEISGSSSEISRTAISALAPGVMAEGEVRDPDALSAALKSFFAEHKLGKTVRLGVANQRVVVRTMRLPLIEDEEELDTAVRFQAQDQIPMPLDQAVLDHQVVARETGGEGERQMDVVAVAARRDMVSALVGTLRKAGLRPAGIDLSAFGMIRALGGDTGPDEEGAVHPTTLYCHLGDITNLAVARGSQCLFTRIANFGIESIAARLAEAHGLPLDEARESLLEIGLQEPVESFNGDGDGVAKATRQALEEGAGKLIDELRVSFEFYNAQEGAPAVERVVVCGPGSTIPGLPERIQVDLGMPIETMSPPALSGLDDEDAARLTVSYGLALEGS